MADAIPWERIDINSDAIEDHSAFPLTTTVMERFLIWDHLVEYPKRFQIVMLFEGAVDRETITEAFKQAIVRHPMLLARVQEYDQTWVMPPVSSFDLAFVHSRTLDLSDSGAIGTGDPRTAADVALKLINRSQGESRNGPAGEAFTEPNLRILVIQSENKTTLAFDAVHWATDGLGMRLFIEDATNCYEALAQRDEQLLRWRTLDSQRLAKRGECPEPKLTHETRKTTFWEKLVHAYHFHFRGPTSIQGKSRRLSSVDGTASLGFRCHSLDLDELRELRQAFSDQSINVNEWAIMTLFKVCHRWKTQKGSTKHRLRVSLPIDMRVRQDIRLSAANKIGFAFVVADQDTCKTEQTLLSSVKEQLQSIRTLSLGNDFVKLFELFKDLGWFVRPLMHRFQCLATAVVTNLGDVTARQRRGRHDDEGRSTVGDLKLLAIYGWPPIRRGTHVGVGICKYNHRLSIAAVFDAQVFTETEIDAFFDEYTKELAAFSGDRRQLVND